jgi:hypothetical protein
MQEKKVLPNRQRFRNLGYLSPFGFKKNVIFNAGCNIIFHVGFRAIF